MATAQRLQRRPHRDPGRRLGLTAAALAGLLAIGGCQPEPTGGEATLEGLLVLAGGSGGGSTLEAYAVREDGPVVLDIELPRGGTAWVSAGLASVLVATSTDGELRTSDPVDPRGPAVDLAALRWRDVEATVPGGDRPSGPAWFAAWDPSGDRFAALGGDLPGGEDMSLVLIDPAAGSALEIPLRRPLLAAPPVWLDEDRVAVLGGGSSEPAAFIVDTTSAEVVDGPTGDRRMATSGDGRVVAVTAGADAPVVVRSTEAWLAADGTSIGAIDPPAEASAIAMALDTDGDRLAIVWLGPDGVRVDVHDGGDGWRRVASQPLDGAAAAAVCWLR
jgi:hypothetical protein